MQPTDTQQTIIDRFVAACQADERMLAATLYGSYATNAADAYSDLDLALITSDESYGGFIEAREAFVRWLGEPLLLEDFGHPNILLVIFSDGTEVELAFGRESDFNHMFSGAYRALLDKKRILADAVFAEPKPQQVEQIETLRRLIYWFWHDLSHFIAAMGRGQLWWAYGQLDELRLMCVNLAHMRHNFFSGWSGYDKLEQALAVEGLSSLQATFPPMEESAMLKAALVMLEFYREVAPSLAQTHAIPYPVDLERIMAKRLNTLCDACLS